MSPDQTKIHVVLHVEPPTNPYRILCSRCESPCGFGLVVPRFTNAYQSTDLAWTLPRVAFTKHRRLVIAIGIICYENYVCGELM